MTDDVPSRMRSGPAVRCLVADQSGFTLIEVVVVMAIMGLLLAVALPAIPHAVSRPQIEGVAQAIAAILKSDHREAIHRHTEIASIVDTRQRLIRSGTGGRSMSLPDGIAVTAILGRSCLGTTIKDRIVFLPDGTSCGGTILLDRAGQRVDIRVNWLTGATELGSSAR